MRDYIERLKNMLLYAGLSQDEYNRIRHDITKSNTESLKIFTVIAAAFLMFMFVFSFFSSNVRSNRWAYFVPLVIIIIISVILRCCPLKERHTLICCYIFMTALYGFGCMLGTVMDKDEQTVTFVALLLTVPLLFTDRPLRMICHIYLSMAVFIVMAINFKDRNIWIIDFINVCIFGGISSIVSSYMMKVKCQRYLYEYEVTFLSEIDLLTELKNRNSFEQSINNYPYLCKKSLCCIYADANSLHELNNTKGHEAGDKMLRCIAASLKKQFKTDDVYRIGGDEFVAFGIDIDSESLKKKTDEIILFAKNEGYHVSVGYDIQAFSEIDMNILVKNAERKMYEEKRRYYEEHRKTGIRQY